MAECKSVINTPLTVASPPPFPSPLPNKTINSPHLVLVISMPVSFISELQQTSETFSL